MINAQMNTKRRIFEFLPKIFLLSEKSKTQLFWVSSKFWISGRSFFSQFLVPSVYCARFGNEEINVQPAGTRSFHHYHHHHFIAKKMVRPRPGVHSNIVDAHALHTVAILGFTMNFLAGFMNAVSFVHFGRGVTHVRRGKRGREQ